MNSKEKEKIKIVFFTGSRADYTTLKPLIKRLKKNNIEIIIYFSGSHFTKILGNTFQDYRNDNKGIKIKKINFFGEVKNFEKKKIFNLGKKKISKQLLIDKPNFIYILGDRYEAMIASLVSYDLGIKIIHSGGGETTLGSKDNLYRDVISKVSSFHMATTKKSFLKLKRKFSNQSVFFPGSAIVEKINNFKAKKNIKSHFFKKNKFVLMTFHPATSSKENISKLMLMSIQLLLDQNYKILITYPNQDPGYIEILKVINKFKYKKNIIIKKNLGDKYFNVVKNCKFLIGNSSSGIIEAPYFKKKVINIGNRQKGRQIDKTVIDVTPNLKKFKLNLIKALRKKVIKSSSNFYGKGNTIQKQVKILNKILV